jgi:peptidoglycan/xylan/chitin deacetylase (PgdA/CDA1 family)
MLKKSLKLSAIFLVVLFLAFGIYLRQNYAIPILMYHSIDESKINSYAAVSPDTFHHQMKFIKNKGYNVISLTEYCQLIKTKKTVPRNSVVITFDDGYKDNLEAMKILHALELPATIFVIVDKIGQDDYLSTQDINWLLDNTKIEVGSHTYSHAYLPDTSDDLIEKEITTSRHELEDIFKCQVKTIAYPIGGFNRKTLKEVAQTGYLCACATNRGFSKKLNRFALRRIKITDRDKSFRLWAKLSGFYNSLRKPKKPF